MSKSARGFRNTARRRTILFAATCIALLAAVVSAQNGIYPPPSFRIRDQRVELAMKIKQPWTLAAVGDMIQIQPFSRYIDPDVQAPISLLRGADMTIANNENLIVDYDHYDGPYGEYFPATKEVADDWVNMGIKMVTRANNRTFDAGAPGLFEDFRQLERVGIVHAGAGKNMADARRPRYYSTPKGLVGIAGMYADTVPSNTGGRITYVTQAQLTQLRAMRDSIVARRSETDHPTAAPAPDNEVSVSVYGVTFKVGPRPADGVGENSRATPAAETLGAAVNTLRVVRYNGVTAEQMAQLRAIAGKGAAPSQENTLSAFGQLFRITHKPGEYTYDMNDADERDILREIKTGKQDSDFMIAVIHWHQNRFAFQDGSFDHYPPEFEIKFAHDVIDVGADAFVAHGVHAIKGVEIYKGKPIFYGINEYVFQSQIIPATTGCGYCDNGSPNLRFRAPQSVHEIQAAAARRTTPPADISKEIVGLGEYNEDRWAFLQQSDNLEAELTTSHWENGQLTEVRIYPIDTGLTPRPGSQFGIPKRPAPEVAKQILDRLVTFSKPFGTKIAVEDGVAVIRVAPH